MSTNKEEIASTAVNGKDVVYSINSYEDARNANVPVSYDPTDYPQKTRLTRALPPKPAYDPLQFIQLKPCSLAKTAQEQMKKEDVVKKNKDQRKEEPEEWQCNLDNWKSSRRKRVEHIIDRVVEVKKLELEEHDRNRRKSKTFNEMMEERCSRRLKYLHIYTDDESNDLSDFGISTTDTQIVDKNIENNVLSQNSCNAKVNEYTYEGAIEDYKIRISRATHTPSDNYQRYENNANQKTTRTANSSKQAQLNTKDVTNLFETMLPEVPKVEFFKRKELFEKNREIPSESESNRQSSDFISTLSVKERLSVLQQNQEQDPNESNNHKKIVPEVSSTNLQNRLEIFEREIRTSANDKEDSYKAQHKSPIKAANTLVYTVKQMMQLSPDKPKEGNGPLEKRPYYSCNYNDIFNQKAVKGLDENENIDTDREDSGIHTTDVSCSVSQADDQNEEVEQLTNKDFGVQLDGILPNGQSSTLIEAEVDETNDINILDDVLEKAFHEIDNMEAPTSHHKTSNMQEPIYQNISCINDLLPQNLIVKTSGEIEPYYQVPKSQEPYYEIPKKKSMPLYENIDKMQTENIISKCDTGTDFTISMNHQEPPKEKPPPPPVDSKQDAGGCNDAIDNKRGENIKRINSTKPIKNALHNERSSFRGTDTQWADRERLLNLPTHSRPVASSLLDEKHPDKHVLNEAGLYDHSDTTDSRDSGVSENHSRQSSDLFITSSNNQEKILKPKIEEKTTSKYRVYRNSSVNNNCFLQVEDILRYQMIDNQLQKPEDLTNPIPSPIPPAKPMRSSQYSENQYNFYKEHSKSLSNVSNLDYRELQSSAASPNQNYIAYHHTCNNIHALSNESLPLSQNNNQHLTGSGIDLSKCESKSRPLNEWAQYRVAHDIEAFVPEVHCSHSNRSPQSNVKACHQTNRNSDWFAQESEQSRTEQHQQAASSNYLYMNSKNKSVNRKSLPESVIQTITQRIQNLGIGSDRRWHPDVPYQDNNNGHKFEQFNKQSHHWSAENDEKILSVSGKKKCSNCNNELGRGAAMVIESLGLLYHITCFKCCVCHTRLGDGFTGTDVRVRKFKLHCQNCFSSEDGVKFSCV